MVHPESNMGLARSFASSLIIDVVFYKFFVTWTIEATSYWVFVDAKKF